MWCAVDQSFSKRSTSSLAKVLPDKSALTKKAFKTVFLNMIFSNNKDTFKDNSLFFVLLFMNTMAGKKLKSEVSDELIQEN